MRGILRVFFRGIVASVILIIIHACSGNNPADSVVKKDDSIITITDTKPKKGLVGTLHDQSGLPLKGATVKAILQIDPALLKTTTNAGVGIDSVQSDSTGLFVFTSLAKGSYNVQGSYNNGELVVLIKDVNYDGDGALLELKTETMRGPGKISGNVIFGEGDSSGIVCSILGTTYLTLSNATGGFTLSGIPQGNYIITYRKDGFKPAQDSGVTVKPGEIAKLTSRELEADPTYPPPPPSGFLITYDTLTGKATLRWRKVKVDDFFGYVLYRNLPSATEPIRLGTSLVKDSFYVDGLFTTGLDSADKEYTYRLKTQDLKGTLSSVYSKPITIKAISPTKVRTTFTWKNSGTKGDSASIGDTVAVTASWSNPSRKTIKTAFYLDTKGTPLLPTKDSALTGSGTIQVSNSKSGTKKVIVEATDETGTSWWDSLSIVFIIDAPVAEAGKDTIAYIHAKINFAGTATQNFGSIVKFKWDFDGDGAYDDSSANGVASHVYDHGASFVAKLLVRDDDGNESTDYRTVQIINQAPVVSTVRADTTVTINDLITFTGSGSDADGPLKTFGWDFDGNGVQDTTSPVSFSPSYRYPKAGIFKAIFRVTDDDAETAERIVNVTVLKDDPVVNAGKDTTISIKDLVRLQGSATDKYGTIASWAWDIGGTGNFQVTYKGDTAVTAPSIPVAAWRCVLRVTDDDGNMVFDTMLVNVLQDLPTANAGKDTTVSIGDAINLHGKGTDVYGTIVERAWSIGPSGSFKPVASSGDTTIIAPLVPTTFVCSLRVTDDDGQIAKQTITVTVVKDVPVVNAGKDTTIAVGQAFTLKGTATQAYGTIAMYKWDWDDNASWDDSSTTVNTTTLTSIVGGTRTVLFGVRDDDGNFVVDTLLVYAVSYVGGTLANANNYLKSLSPYVLTADLTVPTGATLTISAGVKISGPYTILVKGGTLIAVGISADSVIISSPVRFEGTNMNGSEIGYARMSAAEGLRVGNNSLGAGATQNSGIISVHDVSFTKNKVTAEALGSSSKLNMLRVTMDTVTLAGMGNGVIVDIIKSTLKNSTVQSNISNQRIFFDTLTSENSSFLVGGDGANITVKNSSITASNFKEGTGVLPIGTLAFTSTTLTNTTVELPRSVVNICSTSTTFSTVTPLVKIGLGTLFKAKFSGAGTGNGLEITGYNGSTISGATTIDTCEAKNFNIGLLIRNFGTLSISNSNFINNIAYDLSNQSASGFSALNCYWSAAASNVNVNTRIRDGIDDVSFGIVTFSPFITSFVVF
jgi:hypothetical protein